MRVSSLLPLAAIGTAFVIPDAEVMNEIAIEPQSRSPLLDKLPAKNDLQSVVDEFQDTISDFLKTSRNVFDETIDEADEALEATKKNCHQKLSDAEQWIKSNAADAEAKLSDFEELGKHGHHGHHKHKPNKTIYQLISSSEYTTRLTALVDEYDDLVQLLNGTAANYTLFAPVDSAFEKIPEHAPKPTKEELKSILLYHVSEDFYPAGRVLVTHTVPTLLDGEHIGGRAQRLSTNIGLKGLTVNFYSRIIAINIFGTNGVIHGVDSVLVPPINAIDAISLFPGEFSTLELGLAKTDLIDKLNDTRTHVGGTVFAPDNFAFWKLGPKINAFLFSSYGLKYLKALLQYHVVPNRTLYSDAYYEADAKAAHKIPKGHFHVDLPTLLEDKSLSVDIGRFGRLITIRVNAFNSVSTEDGIAADGVIQVLSSVLIPPKSVGGVTTHWHGEQLEVEDLKERLAPYVEQDDTFPELK